MTRLAALLLYLTLCPFAILGQTDSLYSNKQEVKTFILFTPTASFQNALIDKSSTPEAYIKSKIGFGGLVSISFLIERDIRFRVGMGYNLSNFQAYKFKDSSTNIITEVIDYRINQPYLHLSIDHQKTSESGIFTSLGGQISPASYITANSIADSTQLKSSKGFNTSFFLKLGITSNQKNAFNGLDFGVIFPFSEIKLQELSNTYRTVRLEFSLHFRIGGGNHSK